MEYKEKVKYLDIVIANIQNTEMFTISEFFGNKINLKDKQSRDVELDLINFGKKYDLFKLSNPSNTSARWLELTPKGEKLKDFKKGFVKFEKSLTKTPLTSYQKINLPFTIISLIGALTFSYLTFDYKGKNKSLNKDNIILKDSINKLKSKIELYKVSSLNDTL
jgi:hypothetical protein